MVNEYRRLKLMPVRKLPSAALQRLKALQSLSLIEIEDGTEAHYVQQQEQVMTATKDLTGFTMEDAEAICREVTLTDEENGLGIECLYHIISALLVGTSTETAIDISTISLDAILKKQKKKSKSA